MGKGSNPNSKANLVPFVKGRSGNPGGKKKLRDNLADVKLMTKTDSRRLIQKIIDLTPEELAKMAQAKDVPALETMLASVAYKAIVEGDHSRINFLLERTIGKVADKTEHEIVNVTYKTEVKGDGTLLQQIDEEEKAGVDEN